MRFTNNIVKHFSVRKEVHHIPLFTALLFKALSFLNVYHSHIALLILVMVILTLMTLSKCYKESLVEKIPVVEHAQGDKKCHLHLLDRNWLRCEKPTLT